MNHLTHFLAPSCDGDRADNGPTQDDREWDRAWAALHATGRGDARPSMNGGLAKGECGICREDWQYMGSYQSGSGAWHHEFRHRCGLAHLRREVVHIPASHDFMRRMERPTPPAFDPADCGGAYDGYNVTSDADPGL